MNNLDLVLKMFVMLRHCPRLVLIFDYFNPFNVYHDLNLFPLIKQADRIEMRKILKYSKTSWIRVRNGTSSSLEESKIFAFIFIYQ